MCGLIQILVSRALSSVLELTLCTFLVEIRSCVDVFCLSLGFVRAEGHPYLQPLSHGSYC